MTDIAAINYEPLKDMSTASRRALRASVKGWRLPLYILAFMLSFFLTVKAANAWPVFIVGFVYLSHLNVLVNRYKDGAWREFAQANGWSADKATSVIDLVPPSIKYGHSERTGTVVLVQLGTVDASLFTYDCRTGSGKYEQTHNFTIARVELSEELPHMILNSKSAHADIQETIKDDQKISLEGDFNKYFSLLIEQGQQINALEIITPDVMQTLISFNTNEDIEINGHNLYFILNNDKRDYKDMPGLVNSVIRLSKEIMENINLSRSQSLPKETVKSYT